MASAYKVASVTKTVVEVIEPARVNLDLSIEEAEAVAVVLGKVAGNSEKSARGHTRAVLKALCSAGVDWQSLVNGDPRYRALGDVVFSDRPGPVTEV